jgi:hypothetical protein
MMPTAEQANYATAEIAVPGGVPAASVCKSSLNHIDRRPASLQRAR